MNYLVVEGYKDAAAVFESESGESPGTPLDTVASRMRVRQAIQQGAVTEAMEVRILRPYRLSALQPPSRTADSQFLSSCGAICIDLPCTTPALLIENSR